MVGEPAAVPPTEVRHIALDVFDSETLLVEWLTELVYWAESEGLIFTQVDIETSFTDENTLMSGSTPSKDDKQTEQDGDADTSSKDRKTDD